VVDFASIKKSVAKMMVGTQGATLRVKSGGVFFEAIGKIVVEPVEIDDGETVVRSTRSRVVFPIEVQIVQGALIVDTATNKTYQVTSPPRQIRGAYVEADLALHERARRGA